MTGGSILLRHNIDYDDPAGFESILRLGADPNVTSPFGKTALDQAVWRNRSRRYFELLFGHGADPSIADLLGTGDGATARLS